jgi:MFS family permease
MYAIFAKAFPTHVRASGTGIAVGIGRGGSVLAPIIAGFLFQSFDPGGTDLRAALPTVSMIMGLGSFVAAMVLLNLRVEERH